MGIPSPNSSCQWEDISQEEAYDCGNLLIMGIVWIGGHSGALVFAWMVILWLFLATLEAIFQCSAGS